jgi:hypothetical protein
VCASPALRTHPTACYVLASARVLPPPLPLSDTAIAVTRATAERHQLGVSLQARVRPLLVFEGCHSVLRP